ncbi:cell shape-determining protein MreC precursor [bacterium BMS3Abin01]|nr:cell shape-determining protein MreC precursor [bacterium BMS3Abin01]
MVRKNAVKRQAVLAIMLLISVAMLTWYFREPVGGVLHSTQRGGLRIISPLESGISTATGPFKDSYDWMAELFSARSDNERLRQEAEQLRTEVVSLRETEAENEHLRQMLNFVNQPSFPGEYTRVPARVIGRASSAWNATVTINSGSDDGVSLGQTVVNGQGLVGQVSAVATNSAQVLLIIDHTSRVEAKLQPGAAAGTVLGGINGLLEMDFVDKDAKAEANDVVITSGTGRLFVKGVPIGVINEVSDREIEYFKRISITPFVDFNKLEEVLVLIPPAGADQVPLVERGNGG